MHSSHAGFLDGSHAVLTPEYVEFEFVLAGLYSRFLAWLVDGMVVLVASLSILSGIGLVLAAFPGLSSAFSLAVYFLLDWGYGIGMETAWSGQTLGKRMLGLRVIQESGVRIGFFHAALRNLARPFDRLPLLYLVGGSVALFSKSHQRLGDMLAGTIVVRERRLRIPSSIAQANGDAQLAADPQFVSRALQLPAEEREILVNAAIRREELHIDARLKLFAALSERLQAEYGFSRPEYLSDEKLVLLVVAALAAASSSKSAVRKPSVPRRSA
jgi:uncharacterized RDD family membrane protein YckC